MEPPEASQSTQGASAERQRPRQPTVGLVAAEDPVVLENAVTALDHGLDVVMVNPLPDDAVVPRVAAQLGVDVFEPPVQEVTDEDLQEYLQLRGSATSNHGVIVATDSTRAIDFEASLAAHDSDELTEATTTVAHNSISVLVGIPAYNEANTIGDVVREAHQHADAVLVVDDASHDDTAETARQAGATVVEHDENQGYGGALQTLFGEADDRSADHFVILDGDGQHDPSDIERAVETQQDSDADLVIGSRFAPEAETELPFYRRVGLAVVNTLTNLSMGVVRGGSWVRDTQSGFRTYNQRAIESLSSDASISAGMSASTDILYHAHQRDYDIEEFGTRVDYDVEEPSSHNPVAHGLTLVKNILKTIERERPMTTLGIPGFVTVFAGLGFGYWTFSNYLNTGTFPMGLAITSAFFGLAGIFACFTAIILHSLNTHLDE